MSKLNAAFNNISLNEANEPLDRIRQALREAGIVSGELYNLILAVADPIWVSRIRIFEEALEFAAREEHFEDQLKTFADKFGFKATFSQWPKLSELAKAAALGPLKEKPYSFLYVFRLLRIRPISYLHQFYGNNFYSQPIFFKDISRYSNAEEKLFDFFHLLIIKVAEHLIRNFRDSQNSQIHEINTSAFLLQWRKEFIQGNLPFSPTKEHITDPHGSYINLSDLKGSGVDDISSTEVERANEILASSIEAVLGEDLTEFEICPKPFESSSELPVNAPFLKNLSEDRKKESLPDSVDNDLFQLSNSTF